MHSVILVLMTLTVAGFCAPLGFTRREDLTMRIVQLFPLLPSSILLSTFSIVQLHTTTMHVTVNAAAVAVHTHNRHFPMLERSLSTYRSPATSLQRRA
ncbi:hypothetical protein EDD85DRAFT_123754 [Armillaria nabsnona]|nr:hypothetical protein EDD85DRAFT_123754 [Armillaria nabsnona]